MKLNIQNIITRLRSSNECCVNKNDLVEDMELVREVNKKTYQNNGILNPLIKSHFSSGSEDIIEFTSAFFATLLANSEPIKITLEGSMAIMVVE